MTSKQEKFMGKINLFIYDKSWDQSPIISNVKLLSEEIATLLVKMYGAEHIKTIQRLIFFCNKGKPQVSEDRKIIYLSPIDCYQYIYQFSHELCHCITSNYNVSKDIWWFDEFLSCFTSYFVLQIFSKQKKDKILRKIFGDKYNLNLRNYVKKGNFVNKEGQEQHILSIENTQELFIKNRQNYIENKNLIKFHDVYYFQFFEKLLEDYRGLTFIGKIYDYSNKKTASVEELLDWILVKANMFEKIAIQNVINIFGLNLEVNNQRAII